MTALTLNTNGFQHAFTDHVNVEEEEEEIQPMRQRFHSPDMYSDDQSKGKSSRLARISGRRGSPSNVEEVIKPTKTRCRKRKQVKRACSNCRKAHSACGKQRPCPRCVLRKEEHKCVDTPRKKRILEGEDGDAYGETVGDNDSSSAHNTPPTSDDDGAISEHSSPLDTGFYPVVPTPVKGQQQQRRNYKRRRAALPVQFKQQAINDINAFTAHATRTSLSNPQVKREIQSAKYHGATPMDFQQQLDAKLPITADLIYQQLPQQQQQPSPYCYPITYQYTPVDHQAPSFFFQDELLDQHTTTQQQPYSQQPPQQSQQQAQQQQQQSQFSFAPLTSFNDVAYGHNATLQPSLVAEDFNNHTNNNDDVYNTWDQAGFDDFSSDHDGTGLEREVEQMLGGSDTAQHASLAASLPLEFAWM